MTVKEIINEIIEERAEEKYNKCAIKAVYSHQYESYRNEKTIFDMTLTGQTHRKSELTLKLN